MAITVGLYGLTQEKVIPILLHIMKKQHMQISFLFAERRRTQERYSWSRLRAVIDENIVARLSRLFRR